MTLTWKTLRAALVGLGLLIGLGLLGALAAGPARAAISIGPATNERIYLDLIEVCRDLVELGNRTALLKERLYAIGIPSHTETPVPGFEDAVNLTRADVAAGVSIVIDTSAFVLQSRLQACATILRNVPAE